MTGSTLWIPIIVKLVIGFVIVVPLVAAFVQRRRDKKLEQLLEKRARQNEQQT